MLLRPSGNWAPGAEESMGAAHPTIKPHPTRRAGKCELELGSPCRVCPGVYDSPGSQTILLDLAVGEHSTMCK